MMITMSSLGEQTTMKPLVGFICLHLALGKAAAKTGAEPETETETET